MKAYRTMSEYLNSVLGCPARKIAVNAGLSCPNCDGTIGRGGCVYCNNASFNPEYAFRSDGSISSQLEKGVGFLGKRYHNQALLAYFQSYTNTYGDIAHLIGLYEEALRFDGVRGLVIATRPDCLPDELLGYFSRRFGLEAPEGHPYLLVEIGVESTCDKTLERINRGHNFRCAADAIRRLDSIGVAAGAHLILGLPGEDESDVIRHAGRISELPVTTLKLHHLQVLRGTRLAELYRLDSASFRLHTPESYADAVARFLSELRPGIVLDRFVSESPLSMVIAPKWGIKPSDFQKILDGILV